MDIQRSRVAGPAVWHCYYTGTAVLFHCFPSCFFLNMAKPRMFWYSNIFPNCNALDHSATVPLQSKLATFSTTEQFRTLQGYNLIQAYLKWLLFLTMNIFCYLYLSTAHVRVLHAQLCPMGFR